VNVLKQLKEVVAATPPIACQPSLAVLSSDLAAFWAALARPSTA
jgi:hypothetical protein